MRAEIIRKAVHIIVGLLFAFAPVFLSREYILIACVAGIIGATVLQYTAWFLRYFELDRSATGAVYVPIGIGITAWYFLPHAQEAYMFGVLTLALADSAAALVGKAVGMTPITAFGARRTLEGSLAFFITTGAILWFLPSTIPLGTIVIIAVILAHVELFSPMQTDNILVPIAGATLFYFLV